LCEIPIFHFSKLWKMRKSIISIYHLQQNSLFWNLNDLANIRKENFYFLEKALYHL
jgi:hypothetical protein